MSAPGTGRRRVVLELDGEVDAIAGTVCPEGDGEAVAFVGWLGLADALERTAAQSPGEPERDEGT